MNKRPAFTELSDKAVAVGEFLEEHFLDPNGIVYSFLDKTTLRVPGESFFPEFTEGMNHCDFYVPGFSRSELAAYENCGMCTGAYLESLIFRYRLEKDSEVLKKMCRCFNALKYIYNIGKQFEEGFFPKIYGKRFSLQTSSDQVLYAAFALDHFYEFASAAQQKEINVMIPAMVDFWVKRNYVYTYFEQKDKQWPLLRFPPLLLLAYKYSGDEKFAGEYRRLLAQGLTSEPEWAQLKMKKDGRRALSEYEKENKTFVISVIVTGMAMDTMNFEILLSNDLENPLSKQWKQGMVDVWNDTKITLAPSGKHYLKVLVDMNTGAIRLPKGHESGDISGGESGWSTLAASAAVIAAKYHPEHDDLREHALNILEKLNVEDMTYFDRPEQFPPSQRFKTGFLSGDSISNWLWAYWQGRYQKLW